MVSGSIYGTSRCLHYELAIRPSKFGVRQAYEDLKRIVLLRSTLPDFVSSEPITLLILSAVFPVACFTRFRYLFTSSISAQVE